MTACSSSPAASAGSSTEPDGPPASARRPASPSIRPACSMSPIPATMRSDESRSTVPSPRSQAMGWRVIATAPALQARFNGPVGLTVDTGGRVIVADSYNDRIRAIAPDGTVSTLAGSGAPGASDGLAAHAQFDTPCGVAIDPGGRIHVADTGNGRLRVIDPGGHVSTHALPLPEGFARPLGIAHAADGALYVTEGRGRVIEVADGATRTIAGSTPGFAEGPGDVAQFRSPAGVAVTTPGRLVVADTGNALVRVVAARSRIEPRAPASSRVAPRFDYEAFGGAPLLWPVAPMEGPHEIAGTLGEARGGEGFERFHAGIDVRIEEGTPILAVRDGVVSHPIATDDFGSLNEWLRIGSLSYVHVRAGRSWDNHVLDAERFVPTYDESGTLVRVRVKRGARFATGEVIGTVNPFNHVHLNIGWSGEEYNPLQFHLMNFDDTVPPTIARGGVRVFDEYGQRLTRRARGRLIVSGHVQIVVDAWDQTDGNRSERRLGLYDLGYQILNRDGLPPRLGSKPFITPCGSTAWQWTPRLPAWHTRRAAESPSTAADEHGSCMSSHIR